MTRHGWDYELVSYRLGGEALARDVERGKSFPGWRFMERDNAHFPYNKEWRNVEVVTVRLPDGRIRNVRVLGGLGVYGGDEYDLDDLMEQVLEDYGFVTG